MQAGSTHLVGPGDLDAPQQAHAELALQAAQLALLGLPGGALLLRLPPCVVLCALPLRLRSSSGSLRLPAVSTDVRKRVW